MISRAPDSCPRRQAHAAYGTCRSWFCSGRRNETEALRRAFCRGDRLSLVPRSLSFDRSSGGALGFMDADSVEEAVAAVACRRGRRRDRRRCVCRGVGSVVASRGRRAPPRRDRVHGCEGGRAHPFARLGQASSADQASEGIACLHRVLCAVTAMSCLPVASRRAAARGFLASGDATMRTRGPALSSPFVLPDRGTSDGRECQSAPSLSRSMLSGARRAGRRPPAAEVRSDVLFGSPGAVMNFCSSFTGLRRPPRCQWHRFHAPSMRQSWK